MSGIVLLLSQALLYFGVMATLFRLRRLMGLGAFLCALGVMHFLETYLAAVFFIELPLVCCRRARRFCSPASSRSS